MGGGPDNPAHILIEDDDVNPLSSRVNALVVKDEPNDDKVVINIEDSDDDKSGVLDGEDVDSEMDEPALMEHKGELMRELKALGIDAKQKPDYTKPLDEPSWGDSDEEEESDVDMDADGVLDDEDESSEEDEDADLEEDELVQQIKAGKRKLY